MSKVVNLELQFASYWHCGTGVGDMLGSDGIVRLDETRLPFVPGSTLKGILKECVRRFYSLHQEGSDPETLFGKQRVGGVPSKPGILRVTSAELSEVDKRAIQENDLQSMLFRQIQSTAIHEGTKTAKTGSLRLKDAAIPMNLHASVSTFTGDEISKENLDTLCSALPFAYIGIGSGRRRGLGRVKIMGSVEGRNCV